MTQEITVESEPPQQADPPTRWQENHGNLLLTFMAIVFVIGGCVLVYRQNRFVPPRFPESNMIETPVLAVDEVDPEANVTIIVTGAATDFGSIKIAIYQSESTFNQTELAMLSETVSIVDGEATWTVPLQLPNKIAVAAYHDENSDNELNRNQLGIPTERYGFSRNARGLTGPPSFKQTEIDTPAAGGTINIFIR